MISMTGWPSAPNHHFTLNLAIKPNKKCIILELDRYIFQSASTRIFFKKNQKLFLEVSFELGFEQIEGADYVCLMAESSVEDQEFQSFWFPIFSSFVHLNLMFSPKK